MLNLGQISKEMGDLKEWSLETDSISKVFSFGNFNESVDFVNKVKECAEKVGHNTSVFISFDQVRLAITTHEEHGLTRKDFELAREIDKIENK